MPLMPKKPKKYWYDKYNKVLVGGFLSRSERAEYKKLAKSDDKSLSLYVTRVLQKHLKERRSINDPEKER